MPETVKKPLDGWDGSHYFDSLRKQGIKADTEDEMMDCIRRYDWDGWNNPYEIDWKARNNGKAFGCSE